MDERIAALKAKKTAAKTPAPAPPAKTESLTHEAPAPHAAPAPHEKPHG